MGTLKYKQTVIHAQSFEDVKPLTDPAVPIHEYTLNYVLRVLKTYDWNAKVAAKAIGVGERTMRNWVFDLKILGFKFPAMTNSELALQKENEKLRKRLEMANAWKKKANA